MKYINMKSANMKYINMKYINMKYIQMNNTNKEFTFKNVLSFVLYHPLNKEKLSIKLNIIE